MLPLGNGRPGEGGAAAEAPTPRLLEGGGFVAVPAPDDTNEDVVIAPMPDPNDVDSMDPLTPPPASPSAAGVAPVVAPVTARPAARDLFAGGAPASATLATEAVLRDPAPSIEAAAAAAGDTEEEEEEEEEAGMEEAEEAEEAEEEVEMGGTGEGAGVLLIPASPSTDDNRAALVGYIPPTPGLDADASKDVAADGNAPGGNPIVAPGAVVLTVAAGLSGTIVSGAAARRPPTALPAVRDKAGAGAADDGVEEEEEEAPWRPSSLVNTSGCGCARR